MKKLKFTVRGNTATAVVGDTEIKLKFIVEDKQIRVVAHSQPKKKK